MRTKKLWSSFSILVMTVLVVSACSLAGTDQGKQSNTGSGGAPVEIEFWNYWDGQNGEAISALIEEFNAEHPDIRVKNVTMPWGELLPKLQAAIAGKNPPAVAAGDIAWMSRLHSTEALLPLDEAIKEAKVDLEDFYPAPLEYSRYQGKLQALPVSANSLGLFYNKDLFRKAGLDPDCPPQTWEELREAAKEIAALGEGIQGFEIYTTAGDNGEGLTWQFQPFLWQAGGEYLADNYSKPGFNNASGEKALQFLVDLIHRDKVSQPGQWGAFEKGQAGMRIDGSWMVGVFAKQASFDWGTAMIPTPEGGQPATNLGGEQIFVFKTTPEKQAAAIKFVLWLTSTPVQVEWDILTGFMPIRKSVASDPKYQAWLNQEPRLKPFVEQQQFARARPPIPEYPDTSLAFARELEKAFFGQVTVKEALANAENAVIKAMQK
ncbi:MAG TPA: ABC transporter substrate-binding protein [Symbiobacteriaceae bacterium]